MKKFLLGFLKFIGIFLLVSIIILVTMLTCYTPGIKNLLKVKKIADKFNVAVNSTAIIGNTVSQLDIQSTVSKFNNSNRNIFNGYTIEYLKMLEYSESEDTQINLTLSEYSFLQNSLKNSSAFLVDNGFDTLIQKSIFIGALKAQYYNEILLKIDISKIVETFSAIELLENNLYLSISKNYNGIYSFHINNLDDNDNQIMMELLNEFMPNTDIYKNYTLEILGQKLYEEYLMINNTFRELINVDIEIN